MVPKKIFDHEGLIRAMLGFGGGKTIWRAALLLVLGVSLLGVLADVANTAKFGQIDLRNRVVGARVMLLGQNPYTYRWHPGEPTTLLDPYIGVNGSISAVTVSPLVLSVHALFAKFDYRSQKFIWLFAQIALFGGLTWLAMARAETPESRAAVLLGGVMLSCSTFWRLHVERGQAYILFSFFTVLFISSFRWRTVYRGILGGFVLGLLVCLRPHMAMLGIPLLIYRKWTAVFGAVLGVVAAVLSPTLISRTVWPEYVHAMTSYVQVPPTASSGDAGVRSRFGLPAEVEGASNLATYATFGDKDTSFKKSVTYFLHGSAASRLIFILLGVGTAGWVFSIYRQMRRDVPLDFCTVKTLGLVLLIEMVLPIARAEYSNLILVPIVLMFFATQPQLRAIQTWEWVLLLSAWAFSGPFPPWVSAGFRGAGFGMVSECAVLLWLWFTPWRGQPVANAEATANSATGTVAGTRG